MERRVTIRRWTAGLLAVALSVTGLTAGASAAAADQVAVIVGAGSADAAGAAVIAAGGQVDADLDYLGSVVADVPADVVDGLRAAGYAVTLDETVALADHGAVIEPGAPEPHQAIEEQLAAMSLPEDLTGEGVGIALLDTGVSAMAELGDNVTTVDSDGTLRAAGPHDDAIGHGTFMAGLIHSVAPEATIYSINLADDQGNVSMSAVLQGIGRAIELDVQVMNLSVGVEIPRAPRADPLVVAAEAAWASGITVVTAAGNDKLDDDDARGRSKPSGVTSPARSPWIIAVGSTGADHDGLAEFSLSGKVTGIERPDVLAPGTSVVSLRAPGSALDEAANEDGTDANRGRIDDTYQQGSGTSMSAALVSGAVALLAEERTFAVPDDYKAALVASAADPVPGSNAGMVNVAAAHALAGVELERQSHPGPRGKAQGMPWSDEDAPSPEVTWERIRWMEGEWHRIRWMDGDWSRIRWMDGEWHRIRWMDGEWQRVRWMDDAWSRVRWMDGDWERVRWMDADLARVRWMDANFQRVRWMDADWSRVRWMAFGDALSDPIVTPTTWGDAAPDDGAKQTGKP